MLEVKVKKLNSNAKLPVKANVSDAAFDVWATETYIDEVGNLVCKTGLSFELPSGTVCLIYPRSSVTKYDLLQGNSVGVLDSGYRGELLVKFKITKDASENIYKAGDKVAQIIIMELPKTHFFEVENLSDSDRGTGAFGSTGN